MKSLYSQKLEEIGKNTTYDTAYAIKFAEMLTMPHDKREIVTVLKRNLEENLKKTIEENKKLKPSLGEIDSMIVEEEKNRENIPPRLYDLDMTELRLLKNATFLYSPLHDIIERMIKYYFILDEKGADGLDEYTHEIVSDDYLISGIGENNMDESDILYNDAHRHDYLKFFDKIKEDSIKPSIFSQPSQPFP